MFPVTIHLDMVQVAVPGSMVSRHIPCSPLSICSGCIMVLFQFCHDRFVVSMSMQVFFFCVSVFTCHVIVGFVVLHVASSVGFFFLFCFPFVPSLYLTFVSFGVCRSWGEVCVSRQGSREKTDSRCNPSTHTHHWEDAQSINMRMRLLSILVVLERFISSTPGLFGDTEAWMSRSVVSLRVCVCFYACNTV